MINIRKEEKIKERIMKAIEKYKKTPSMWAGARRKRLKRIEEFKKLGFISGSIGHYEK